MERPQRLHFVGVGGIGMSAIAQVMLEEGRLVTGSDLKASLVTQRLAARGATIFEGHRAENVGTPDIVIRSSAVPDDNPEVEEARRRGIPVVKRAVFLGQLMTEKRAIAVAGTHGKSTTSSLIGMALLKAGLDPTLLIGADPVELGTNARLGRGPFLVAEADEFDGSLREFHPWIAVVTNIEAEHLDYYGTYESLQETFRNFTRSVPEDGHVLLCSDDQGARGILEEGTVTYGLRPGAEWQALEPQPDPSGGYRFDVACRGRKVGEFSSPLPGLHNVCNAVAAIAVCDMVGIPPETVAGALSSFQGVARRFQAKGQAAGVTIVDDYAHHPTEIRATLRAARERFGEGHLICLFQPHTYSRTKLLMEDFAQAFGDADEVLIADIYAAREVNTYGVTSADLAAALQHPRGRWVGSLQEAHRYLTEHLREGDILLTVGAGDIDMVGDWLLKDLAGEALGISQPKGGKDDAAKK
ncbi:MAG: UDP-N-acetylmuramate--L-alanine ligase [Dehalococcoidia bacterium]|nr:UDP-N-acetylmuramate--L-alanine ligase [Dehalococcoidia bacterium]